LLNEWLSGLSNDLTDSQKLNALATWLKAQPCIYDATLRSEKNEIVISFDVNGISKSFVLEFTTSPPLKVSGIREYEEEKPIAVTGVELNHSMYKLSLDDSFTLAATVLPANAANQKVTWAIEEGGEAFVSIEPAPDGMSVTVTAIDFGGEAVITATTEDGAKTAQCVVVIEEPEEGSYPIEISFSDIIIFRYPLAPVCEGKNLKYDNKLMMINSKEELHNYISCSDENYPEIDFSKHTVLLANGRTHKGIAEMSKRLWQLSVKKYQFDVEIYLHEGDMKESWVTALLVNKLSEKSYVELNLNIYPKALPFSKYSLEGTSCQWIYNNVPKPELIIVTNNDDLENYMTCTDDHYPSIDFSTYTLLLVRGFTANDVSKMTMSFYQQLPNKYELNVASYKTDFDEAVPWVIPLIISKLSEDSNIKLNINFLR